MPFCKTQHHTLRYTVMGNRTLPPLLLLHGFLGNHQDFNIVLNELSNHFYCILPDLPGHGQTISEPDSYNFPATAATLVALLQELDIQQSYLLGYSMGGRIALYLTCEFPEYFSAVVLESASPGLRLQVAREERVRWDDAIARKIEKTPLPNFLTQWYTHPMFNSLKRYPERYNAMLYRRQSNHPTEIAKALRGLSTGRQPSLWENLSSIKQPLLLLAGTLDPKFVTLNQEIIAATKSSSKTKLVIVEDCGHNIHLEAPGKHTQTVAGFLLVKGVSG